MSLVKIMNLSNDLSNIDQSGNTGNRSSGSLNENISAKDINDNWIDEISITDIPPKISLPLLNGNLENHQTQELQSQSPSQGSQSSQENIFAKDINDNCMDKISITDMPPQFSSPLLNGNLENHQTRELQSQSPSEGSQGNISAKDINDNWMDEISITDMPSQFSLPLLNGNLENHQTQELQSQSPSQGSQSLQGNISAKDINDNWMDEISITDMPPQISLPLLKDSLPKSRRARTRYTTYQIYEMEKVFLAKSYPTKKEKKELAERLNLNELKIKTWFANRRIKENKIENKQTKSQNTEPTVSNGPPELNVQFAPMNYYNNANNSEKNFNSRVHPPIQKFQSYRPSSTINVPRNNSHLTYPSVPATNWREEYVPNIGYPQANNLNYLNYPSRMQGLPPPPPNQVVPHLQDYQYYNQLHSQFQNLHRPRFPPK